MQRRGAWPRWLLTAIAAMLLALGAAPGAVAAVGGTQHAPLRPSAAPATPAGPRSGADIADVLRTSGVYADPRAKPTLAPAEQSSLDAEIERQDPTRIKIAITTPGVARRAGGLEQLANEIDQALDGPGVVVVIAGEDAWFITAYSDTDAAVEAARRTLNDEGTLAAQLRNLIPALAAVDPDRGERHEPKPKPSSGSSGNPAPSAGDRKSDDDTGSVIGGLIILGVVFGGPVWFAIWRYRRRYRGSPSHTSAAGFSADMAQQTANLSSTESVDQANRTFGRED